MLVSNEDVENYKQIKADLDELRLLVEKSELWVYKGKSSLITTNQPLALKKRKSKLPGPGDKVDGRVDESGHTDVRESVSSTQVQSLILLFKS